MRFVFIFILLALVQVHQANRFSYNRVLSCDNVTVIDSVNNISKCIKWSEETTIKYFYGNLFSYCFSEGTYVMTAEGPKAMRELGPEDQLLGMNQETAKNQFSKIKTWLHRDELAIAKYATISTNTENVTFEASDYHNIAFLNAEGKIDFKFTKNLEKGNELVSFPEKNLSVSSVGNYQEKKGLFSPFTEIGNYYVFHEHFDIQRHQQKGQNEEPMILVHVLSQVTNPNSELYVANKFIDLASSIGYKQQPTSEIYVNPLISSWNFLFGSNWNGTLQQIKYKAQQKIQKPKGSLSLSHNQFRTTSTSSYSRPSYSSSSYSSPSYSSYRSPSYSSYSTPSYSSYSSPSYYNSYNSYSTPYYNSYSSGYSPYLYGSAAGAVGYGYANHQESLEKLKGLGQCISILLELPLLG